MSARYAWLGLGVILGCATGTPPAPVPPNGVALLQEGKGEAAERALVERLARAPGDALAAFALGTLAYERGDAERAGDLFLRVLEHLAPSGGDGEASLPTATLSRLVPVLDEVRDRRPLEARLLALSMAGLPWSARYGLCTLSLEVARRRGDATLFTARREACGAVPSLSYTAEGGAMPWLDLAGATSTALPRPVPCLSVGLQQQLRTADATPGVKVLRGRLTLAGGEYDLVVDTPLPLRFRVDGGPWQEHATRADRYEPRWSAHRMRLAAGDHALEIRLASYGSTAEFSLVAMPGGKVRGEPDRAAGPPPDAWGALVAALAAHAQGDSRALAQALAALLTHPRFALGLAAAGRLAPFDPSRPLDILRDKAHGYSHAAVALDPSLARAWMDLSQWEAQNERPREAAGFARRATEAAPRFWPAFTALAGAYQSLGFDRDAEAALRKAAEGGGTGWGACGLWQRLFEWAEDREDFAQAKQWIARLETCDATAERPRRYARDHGDLKKAADLALAALPFANDPVWLLGDLAELAIAQGDLAGARADLETLARLAPRDTQVLTHLVDLLAATGQSESRALLATLLRRFPDDEALRRAARLAGVVLAWERHRLDGGQVVAAFQARHPSYSAPQVVVLDRAVEQILPDGVRLILTHSITQVLSKDAIAQVGEAKIPEGAEILALRTRKANGEVREAEAIPGKASISVPDLAVGDFVEVETLEVKPRRESFGAGFLSERFYFQSFDAPFARSEYVVLVPPGVPLAFHPRGDAPVMETSTDPDGIRVLTFRRKDSPQLFPERQATPAQEWIPQVAISSQASLRTWSRFFADRLARVTRGNAELDHVAADLAAKADGRSLPEAIVAWVNRHIEPEKNLWEPATHALARGRGNRAAVALALARRLAVPADFVLARPGVAEALTDPLSPTAYDSFADLFVRFPSPTGDRFYDPRLLRSPFGYLLESYVGSPAVVVGTDTLVTLRSTVADAVRVKVSGLLLPTGEARLTVEETLQGWPALEWRELWERVGKDAVQRRQEFEQRWLGQHFPGARLVRFAVHPSVGETRLECELVAPHFAEQSGARLRLQPTFYQAQPGRRFATEPTRKTGLQIAFTLPLDLTVELTLAPGLRWLDLGGGDLAEGAQRFPVPGMPAAVFLEERAARGNRLVLHRESRLPTGRVSPAAYPEVAAVFRRVDAAESAEILIAPVGQVE